jgi:predicted SAM-dependent methyltransferase
LRLKNFIKQWFPVIPLGVAAIRHKVSERKIRRILATRPDICIELGAGSKKGQGSWVTIDTAPDCDIHWDLRRGIPFPDEGVQKIYSSHFFEHLSFKDTQVLLDECKRVLVKGGTFSICVPNARIYLEAYANRTILDRDKYFGYKPAYNNTTPLDYVNYTAYMDGEHRYMFDEDNLLYILESKGFKNVCLREFDPSVDLRDRDFESLYAEAQK